MNYYFYLLFFICYIAKAQKVNKISLQELPAIYIEVSVYADLNSKTAIQINYGQQINFFKAKEQTLLKDEKGNVMRFNSMIEGLNFLYERGFVLHSVYTITKEENEMPFFILKNENYTEKNEV